MSSDEEAGADAPDAQLARALDRWKAPPAREEFRARLREQFLTAPFDARVEGDGLESEPKIHVEESLRPDFSFERRRAAAAAGPARRRWASLAALAAIAALALIVLRFPRASAWRVLPSSTFTKVMVDGRQFSSAQAADLAASLAAGTRVEVEGGSLELALDRRLALSLASGSSLQLASIPGRDVQAQFVLRQERGSLALATGPDFSGWQLSVQAAHTLVRVVGTQVVIDMIPGEGTCICCRRGVVEVWDAVHPAFAVPGGRMGFTFGDGSAPIQGELVDEHLAPMETLRRVWGPED